MKNSKLILLTTALSTLLFGCASKAKNNDAIQASIEEKSSTSYEAMYEKENIKISNLKYFERGYPDITFTKKYDKEIEDWLVTVSIPDFSGRKDIPAKVYNFYWCNGKMLPKSELKNQDKYWSLLTYYPKEIPDPELYTDNIIEDVIKLGTNENRRHGKGTPMFFFDAIYDTHSRKSTEKHIARLPLINRWINVHEKLEKPLERVSQKMWAAAKTDKEVNDYIYSIKVYEAYSWREITGTSRKSFHGAGIAIDALPRDMGEKQIFWGWAKRYFPETWPILPLSSRWMPPEKVIKIFESEGFVWGGKWALWDNMHFEYHPELILYNHIK